jgi:aminopeptidase-like protein
MNLPPAAASSSQDGSAGEEMFRLLRGLFPICRSITGDGVRQTLSAIREYLPALAIHEVPSGMKVFDWTIPDEWNIRGARLVGPGGETIVDFRDHNLHVVGYSVPVDVELSLDELQEHLHSIPEQPDAIPYVTSYYRKTWGFCLPHRLRVGLRPGRYRAWIDSTLAPGHLTYGEWIRPGKTSSEILLSTYICHPSMANNELSGPAVTTWLARWLSEAERRYTYRIVFVPETIGSIAYLSRNLDHMKRVTVAGFNVSCVGDERAYSYLPSRLGGTLADRVVQHVLEHVAPGYTRYTFRDRGSDERQYCSPGVDLPVCSLMRSKYGEYPEYHTSLDDLELVTPAGLAGSFHALRRCLECLERNETLQTTVLCEPQLGKRGLYPLISNRDSGRQVAKMMHILAYSDGNHDLLQIADLFRAPVWELWETVEKLKAHGLLASSSPPAPVNGCREDR